MSQECVHELPLPEDRDFLSAQENALKAISEVEDPVYRMQLLHEQLGQLLPLLNAVQKGVNACVQGSIQAAEEARAHGLDTSWVRSGFDIANEAGRLAGEQAVELDEAA